MLTIPLDIEIEPCSLDNLMRLTREQGAGAREVAPGQVVEAIVNTVLQNPSAITPDAWACVSAKLAEAHSELNLTIEEGGRHG